MSTFTDAAYQWRDPYFVLFPNRRRPSLQRVREAMAQRNPGFDLRNASADEAGLIEALTVVVEQDNAALDISYLDGEEVLEQRQALIDELKGAAKDEGERQRIAMLPECDARLDVMHFERLSDSFDEDLEEMVDPTSLLAVLDVLATVTEGVSIDPQSGTLM